MLREEKRHTCLLALIPECWYELSSLYSTPNNCCLSVVDNADVIHAAHPDPYTISDITQDRCRTMTT